MPYPGGKGGDGVYQTIINQMPPHHVYIEPFLGGGSIMRHKRPAQVNIGVDIDSEVIAAFDLPGVRLVHADALAFLYEYPFSGNELVYCDPPYLMSTRSCQRDLYRHEFSETEHVNLLTLLRMLPEGTKAMVSGYWSELYAKMLDDWRVISYQSVKRSGAVATEFLWMNYAEPVELHDYRYLGRNFRERERIKRKKTRWERRFVKMPVLERRAMLSAIEELRGRGAL